MLILKSKNSLIIRKLYRILGIALLIPSVVLAAFNDVQTDSQISVNISDLSIDLQISSGGKVEQIQANSGNVIVTMSGGSKVVLTSLDRRTLGVSGTTSDMLTYTNECQSDRSVVTMELQGNAASREITVTPASTSCNAGGGGGGGGGGATPAVPATPATPATPGVSPAVPATPAIPAIPAREVVADAPKLVEALGLIRNAALEAQLATKVHNSAVEFRVSLSAEDKNIATNFATYGISEATKKFGSGERLALIRDQLETLGRVSLTALEQLANGTKPTDRNLSKEVSQLKRVLPAFEKLLGRKPNFQNSNEDLAWNTLLYRVRFTRDLNKERVGIAKFKILYARNPNSPLDWAVVRAWGYALNN